MTLARFPNNTAVIASFCRCDAALATGQSTICRPVLTSDSYDKYRPGDYTLTGANCHPTA